jgi:hypothetical protein
VLGLPARLTEHRNSHKCPEIAEPAKRRATYEDLLAVPSHLVAEIIAGELVTHPRPGAPHARTASGLGMDIGTPRAEPFDAVELDLGALWSR